MPIRDVVYDADLIAAVTFEFLHHLADLWQKREWHVLHPHVRSDFLREGHQHVQRSVEMLDEALARSGEQRVRLAGADHYSGDTELAGKRNNSAEQIEAIAPYLG